MRQSMAGAEAVSYTEIKAFCDFAGISLGRTAIMIRKLSAAYAAGYNDAGDDDSPAPWAGDKSSADAALAAWLEGLT